jgi:hypothetical protein
MLFLEKPSSEDFFFSDKITVQTFSLEVFFYVIQERNLEVFSVPNKDKSNEFALEVNVIYERSLIQVAI